MSIALNRRELLKAAAITAASVAFPSDSIAKNKKSVLAFTKSSGFEHDVVKRVNGKPSIVDNAVTELGNKHGFEVTSSKDGGIFDFKDFHNYAAVVFFTTGVLTTEGTDKNPAISAEGKQSLLNAIHNGLGFVGVHA